MTNEEKAKDMTQCIWYPNKCTDEQIQELLVEMAKWKDEQFAVEKAALIDRIADKFEFENFTFSDFNGGVTFDYAKFYVFLEKISK